MPKGRLEHVNISVSDAERTARLFEKLCGWHRRWEGPSMANGHTIHLGDEQAYVSIYTNDTVSGGFSKGQPMNHIGLAVDDLETAKTVVTEAGLEPFSEGKYDPGPRTFYFFDWDGIEWEIVSYE